MASEGKGSHVQLPLRQEYGGSGSVAIPEEYNPVDMAANKLKGT